MADIITLTIPHRITHNSSVELTSFFSTTDLKRNAPKRIIFDITQLEYFDTEGMGYLALLPFHLKLFCEDIVIRLPSPSSRVATFFTYTHLLHIFIENFPTPGFRIPEDYNFAQKRFPRNPKSVKSNIDVFKKDAFSEYVKRGVDKIQRVIENDELSQYFRLCFYELTQNIFEHSGEAMGSFAYQYRDKSSFNRNSTLEVAITDIGIGIKESLRKNRRLVKNESDIYYLSEAIRRGVSGTSEIDRGIGLYDVVNFNSEVQITSGTGVLKTLNGKITNTKNIPSSTKGTSVFIVLPL